MIWSDAPVNADTKTDINNRKPHMEWNLCLCLSCKREQNAWHQTCLCSQLCSSTTDFFFFLRADEWHIDERGGFAADEDAGNSNSCTSWGKERFHMPGGGGHSCTRAPMSEQKGREPWHPEYELGERENPHTASETTKWGEARLTPHTRFTTARTHNHDFHISDCRQNFLLDWSLHPCWRRPRPRQSARREKWLRSVCWQLCAVFFFFFFFVHRKLLVK